MEGGQLIKKKESGEIIGRIYTNPKKTFTFSLFSLAGRVLFLYLQGSDVKITDTGRIKRKGARRMGWRVRAWGKKRCLPISGYGDREMVWRGKASKRER